MRMWDTLRIDAHYYIDKPRPMANNVDVFCIYLVTPQEMLLVGYSELNC